MPSQQRAEIQNEKKNAKKKSDGAQENTNKEKLCQGCFLKTAHNATEKCIQRAWISIDPAFSLHRLVEEKKKSIAAGGSKINVKKKNEWSKQQRQQQCKQRKNLIDKQRIKW